MRLILTAACVALVCACASGRDTADTDPGSGGGVITGVGGSGVGAGDVGGMSGLPLGAACTDDAQCASDICEEVFLDLPDKVCVERCTDNEDCPSDLFFCEAISAGSVDGYCIPRSPAHCVACDTNADCGYFTELCIMAPGDDATACHVDCDIAGQAACPDDYTCESVQQGNATRHICIPNEPRCSDALGGFCDNITAPLGCVRQSADGVCLGDRTCDPQTERYSVCGATEPTCKATCEDPDPTGCTLQACGNAANTAEHCGMCGTACPGVGAPNASPTCDAGSCAFNCSGESYDVDNNTTNGCEATDSPTGNHTSGTAIDIGTFPCNDGSSNRNISGTIHSDQRAHISPAVTGFDATTGAAPDWYEFYADGGSLCQNEVVLTLDVNGTGNLACYRLTVITNVATYTCNTNASGVCNINEDGTGAYSDNTDVFVEVKKTCGASAPGSVTYTVTGHL